MAVCRSCGADLPVGARFCASCGTPVSGGVGDERKVVTVLFADLVGSTAIGSGQDPEEFGATIRPQLARMREALERNGGTIEKYIGDAVVAVFGAPVTREDDPERGVRAALAIRDALGDAARVAVNTGEAVVSLGARADRGEEILLGDVVNTAYRIEEATPAGAVFVGEATYRATRNAIEYREQKPIEAKGKRDPVVVWEALRAKSTVPVASERTPQAPLVGRAEELTLILNTLARSQRHETTQLVTLIGAAGIGKSRLAWELQQTLERRPDPVKWLRGRCLPYGEDVAYWALNEIVKSEAGIVDSDDASGAARKLGASVRDLVGEPGEAAWVEGHLRPLLGLANAAPRETREETFSAWRTYIESLAERSPLVLVLEDLHWADEGLLDFIEHVADWSRDAPVLLLCTARPDLQERRVGWGGHANAMTITLLPLTGDETAQLLSLLLSESDVPDELRETLLARAEGNPLYAEEFVRMLVDRGLLVLEGDAWTLRASEVPVPESVQGIIAARLDALDSDEKLVLQAASVIGRTFWPDGVAAVASLSRDEMASRFRELDRRGLLRRYRPSPGGESEYAFRHALVRDVAYGQISRARRGEKHLLAARWFESLGRPDDHAETAAHHYLAALEYMHATGGDVESFAEQARESLRRAGDRALALNAFASAARFFGGALGLSPTDEELPGLLFAQGKALARSGAPDEDVLAQARESMRAAGDVERAAECQVILAELHWRGGRRELAFDDVDEALALLADQPPSYAKAYAFNARAQFQIRGDEAAAARDSARAAIEIAEELGLDDLRADALITIGLARVTTGDAGGLEDLEHSIRIAEEANSPQGIRAYLNLASMLANLGDLRRAAALYGEGQRLAERFGDAAWAELFEAERLYEQYWSGHWDEAWSLAEDLLMRSERAPSGQLELDARLVRAWIALARGDLPLALEDSERALAFSRDAADPQNLYPALALRARTLAASDELAGAAANAEELLQLMREQPSLPSFWVMDLALALSRLGRGDELAKAADDGPSTRWLEAAAAYAAGEPDLAADRCAEIGALPEEGYARLEAADVALAAGRRSDAEQQLAHVREFYRQATAGSYSRRAEAVLSR